MFLKSKEVAYTGILMALAVILVTIGGYWEGSTLFFLAAASFLAGMVSKNISVAVGGLFVFGSVVLSFILAPEKFYCFTYLGFCLYVLLAEQEERKKENKTVVSWIKKGILFHVMLIVALLLVNKLFGFEILFSGKLAVVFEKNKIFALVLLVAAAELVWVVFDRAYVYFRKRYGQYFIMK